VTAGPLSNPFEPTVRKDAADYNDPSPIEAEHVFLLMSKNFPPDAIGWVKRARWTGPQWVPWDRVDTDDKDKWAASRQPAKVKEFEDAIKAHDGRVAPSILVQEPKSNKAFIVDGHHRALARENLGQKVLAYLGNIDPNDRQAAEETHSKQIHSGSDPRNKQDTGNLLAKLEHYWYLRELGHPVPRKEVYKVLAGLRDAGRDEFLLDAEARGFGWTLGQLDSPFLRAWLCGEAGPANKAEDGKTSAEVLRQYWTHEGHPGPTQYALEEKIRWGEPGDWYRCVDELAKYIGDGAKGYCNLRHKEVLGYYPAQHAQMEEGK
jgi:hypothetical protein